MEPWPVIHIQAPHAEPDSAQQRTNHPPNYVYTPDGIFRMNDDLVVQDLDQPTRVPFEDWTKMFVQQTCFSGDAIVQWVIEHNQQPSDSPPLLDDQSIVVTRRVVQRADTVAQGEVPEVAEVCWFVRILIPTDLPSMKRLSNQAQSTSVPMGDNFLWPLTIEMATDLYKNFNEVLAEDGQSTMFPELRPTHQATDLSMWSSEDATLVEYMPDYYDRIFALSIAPALHTPRTSIGSKSLVPPSPGKPAAEWIAPRSREWLSKSTLARESLLGAGQLVRSDELRSGFDLSILPDDIVNTILNEVVIACTESVVGSDFLSLLKLRTVCKGWKMTLESRASQRLSLIVNHLKSAIHSEDTRSLMRVKDIVLGHGISVPRLLGDSRTLDFYNFMRLRFCKRPGALPPDVPRKRQISSIEGTKTLTNKRIAFTFPLEPMGPMVEG
jgi:hypothetical protein